MDPTATSGGPSRFWIFAVVGVVVTAGVVAAILVAGSGGGEPDRPASSTADGTGVESTGVETTGVDDPAAIGRQHLLELAIAELSPVVEDLRGLPFLEPVDAAFLDDASFRERLSTQLDEDLDDADIADVEEVWKALRLVDRAVDLEAVLRRALGEGVLGFYDPETDELVLRGVVLDDFVRSTLVHELTHALDDQHFDLDRVELMDGEDGEAQFGFIGLVEGTASWVEDRWVAALDAGAVQALRESEARFGAEMDLSGLPDTLLIDLSLPYVLGPVLVEALVSAGGTDGIDAAYLDPPTTGEQLFEPEAYLAGEGAVSVDPPPADGPVFFEGVVGASGLYEMLLVADPARAAQAARDWGGDRFVAWHEGDLACLRADIAADGAEAFERLRSALGRYALTHGDAEIEARGTLLRLTACG